MKPTRIIGIDPGTGILGFGVIDVGRRSFQLVDAGVITTKKTESDATRLQIIHDDLREIIEQTKPTIMSVEKLFFARNVTTAMTVSQARGVVLLLAAQFNLEIHEFTPMQIKQSLTGYGKAEKSQIQEMVRMSLKLTTIPKPDDCADALAAALTCAASLGLG